jgi:hypothetical protein
MLMIFRPKREDAPDGLRSFCTFRQILLDLQSRKIRRAGSVPRTRDMRNACVILLRNLKGGDYFKDLRM